MTFRSILFARPEDLEAADRVRQQEPAGLEAEAFADLHLDQVIEAATAGRDEYDLGPLFRFALTDVNAVRYRQEVFRDLETDEVDAAVRAFAKRMRAMRERRAEAERLHYYRQEQERWLLDAVDAYVDAVVQLAADLDGVETRSRGFDGLRLHLAAYLASEPFATLRSETQQLKDALARVRYRLQIMGPRIRISRADPSEPDYGAEVLDTFEKFRQEDGPEYRFTGRSAVEMNHVEAAVVERVALLFPDEFGALDAFCERHADERDETIVRFDREIQFYLAWLDHLPQFRAAGLRFCYPDISADSKEIAAADVFDLALADLLIRERSPVVTNEFELHDPERIIVVSGPNQGGKTTFARTMGQLHHLGRIGLLVPGSSARLFLVDRVLAHFEREEDLENLSGKLEHDLTRFRALLEAATSRSLILMNESFGSTMLEDQVFLNRAMLDVIVDCDALCVCVTFLDELASLGPTVVSMMSTVDPDEPARRTFKVIRKPADGLAYAAAIARKYGLTYGSVKDRVAE